MKQDYESRLGKYDDEAQPFFVNEKNKKIPIDGTYPLFHAEILAYKVDSQIACEGFDESKFRLKVFHIMDITNRESVRIMKHLMGDEYLKTFKKEASDEKERGKFYGLFLAPNIKTALHLAYYFPNTELYEIDIERPYSGDNRTRATCYYRERNPNKSE